MRINLTSYFLCCRQAGRRMIAQGRGGAIMNMCSIGEMCIRDSFPFVEALETCGYAGAISVETFPQEPWQDPRAAARRALVAARRFVRKETSK